MKLIFLIEKFQKRIWDKSKNSNEAIQAARVVKWFKNKGDETLRLDYALDENSIVFDIGGYKGEFARDIYCKYNSTIYIFEPVTEFYNEIVNRFVNNPKVQGFNFGLGDGSYMAKMSLEDNGSSLFKKGASDYIEVEIRSFNDFIEKHNITRIELAKINIEGAEYDLLESIIEAGNIEKITNIQVQFHDFVIENAIERMNNISEKLSRTHELTYHYEFVWDNWKLKELLY
ncbi:MAG: FkbM family methyltransferase [Ferruginibacter sp.]